MKLDGRIINPLEIYSPVNAMLAQVYIGQNGIFSNNSQDFENLKNAKLRVLTSLELREGYTKRFCSDGFWYEYFLPLANVENKKYIPCTLDNWSRRMKEKMSTFTAMDVLGCHLYWINLNVKNIKDHHKYLEKLFDKFEIEKDYDGTDVESIIIDYILSLRLFIKDTENVSKQVNEYLKGRGISPNMGVGAKGVEE